jgi:hypothetical protein
LFRGNPRAPSSHILAPHDYRGPTAPSLASSDMVYKRYKLTDKVTLAPSTNSPTTSQHFPLPCAHCVVGNQHSTHDKSHSPLYHHGAIVQVVPRATAEQFHNTNIPPRAHCAASAWGRRKKSHSTLDHHGTVAQAVLGLMRSNCLAVFDHLRVILAEVRCCCTLTAQQLEVPRSQLVAGTSIILRGYAVAA